MDNNIEVLNTNPEPMPKKGKNKGLIVLIIFLILIILGLVGFIVYDKGILFNSKKEIKEEEKIEKEVIDEELEDVDYAEANELLNKYFEEFASYRPLQLSKDNSSSTAAFRRILLVSMIININKEHKLADFDQTNQCGTYVTKDFFKDKYKKVYGDNYSFDSDYRDPYVADFLSSVEENYCWLYLPSPRPCSYEYAAKKLEKEGDQYVLSGDNVASCNPEVEQEPTLKFKVIYTKDDDERHLVDIIIE